jgi:hypothetical protein
MKPSIMSRRKTDVLNMAAISYVFTLRRVAKMLDEDEDILHEIAMDMEPEDGRIYVMDIDDDESIVAFTEFGIENLKETLADRKREAG